MTFLEAVARQEGFYAQNGRPDRPERDNNPGDIEWAPAPHGFAYLHGATRPETLANGMPGRFAYFPNVQLGLAAEKALFQTPMYAGLTVAAALNKWAPPVENQTNAYIADVCQWSGCKPTDIVDTLLQMPVSS